MLAAEIGSGDEVIVPALTFAASANCARYAGATVRFADVRPDTMTIDVDHVASLIGERTRAVIAVDYGGLPADLDELRELATRYGLIFVEDACHAPGARYKDRAIGAIADMTAFSLHPVKHMTTGEGGVVTTNDDSLAARVRLLRSHGIATDHRQRELAGTWRYDMVELGFNYRLTDIQCALGLTQLAKMPKALARRREIAMRYAAELGSNPHISLPVEPADREHAWHLYPIRLVADDAATLRQQVFAALRAAGIGVNVHYIPVYLHSYYRSLGYSPGLCPRAERAYDSLLSLPMWHGLSDDDQSRVIAETVAAIDHYV
jgi:perosamine synthetase